MENWANKFSFGPLTVAYSTYAQGWEVVEKKGEIELAFRWFPSLKKAEAFAYSRLKGTI